MKQTNALRAGHTTGSCAAAAAHAAALLLLCGEAPASVTLDAPGGRLTLPVASARLEGGAARCAVQKDAGDDPDVTDGVLVWAAVRRAAAPGVSIDGGEGVGRVTRPGLDQPVGAAAINSVPRRMIERAVLDACGRAGFADGLSVVVSIPGGLELARRTYNPRLGIEGGLSVLGTTGIVHPMSEQALVDTIAVELRVLRASGVGTALVTPGNYGESFLSRELGLPVGRAVKCANFIGEAVDLAAGQGFSGLLLVGHLGKLVKVAAGILNTHSKYADARMEILAAHAALAGAPRELIPALMDCVTTDDALSLLDGAGLRGAVMDSLAGRIERHLALRAGPDFPVGALVFSNRTGVLARTRNAGALLRAVKEEL